MRQKDSLSATSRLFLSVSGLVVFLAGCNDYNVYSLELTPRGQVIERTLTCWRIGKKPGQPGKGNQTQDNEIIEFPQAELAAIAKHYGVATPPDKPKKHHFAKQFTERLPADVGGRGTYSFTSSPLGDTAIYVERFRGSDDVIGTMAQREAAIDALVDLLLGWIRQEMNNDADFAKVTPFLDRELRHDLKNLLRYGWLAVNSAAQDEQAGKDVAMRAGQYLLERGYFTLTQLPDIFRALQQDDEMTLLRMVRRLLANKMGLGAKQPLPQSFSFLTDPARIERSWNAFVAKTPQYKKMLNAWKAENPKTRGEPTKPGEVIGSLQHRATAGLLELGRPDTIELRLKCKAKPWLTNGKWNNAKKQVVWNSGLAREAELPTLCHAMWSMPNVSFQKEHFGKTVVDGENLQTLVLWHQGLTDKETAEWDRFVSELKPDGASGSESMTSGFHMNRPTATRQISQVLREK